ncbi:MAG TPA: tetratricopeptide repeat protein, partial [Gemmatimonadales bacterium]
PCRQPGRPIAPAPYSVAVLYFDNLSPDTADAYLADGLTDEIIARLGSLERLQVKSRTAVARYRATSLGPPQLGRALGVTYLVNGSVRRGGARLRMTVELLRASDGDRVWGQQYDRTDGDLLAIEGDIAGAVAHSIAGRLAPAEQASLTARPTRSAAAYDHFVKGNFYLAQRRSDAAMRAIQEYDAALALDSSFLEPLARIALEYALFLDWGWSSPGLTRDSILARGLAAADLALRRDSTSSDAWMARAFLLKFRFPQTYAGVRAAFERAIASDPRNAEAMHQYASSLSELGDDAAAAAANQRALVLEPERAVTLFQFSQFAMIEHRFAEEERWLDSALAIDPGFFPARTRRAIARARRGDRAGALVDFETARQLRGEGLDLAREQALLDGLLGDSVDLRAALQRMERELVDPAHPNDLEGVYVARALVVAHEPERAIAFLERVEPRGIYLWWLLRWEEFDPIRADPRFQRLVDEARPR